MLHIIVKHGFLFMGIVTGVIGVSCLCWMHCVFDRFRLTAIKRNFQRDLEIMNKKKSTDYFFLGGVGCWYFSIANPLFF
jgi:hypothetical protein